MRSEEYSFFIRGKIVAICEAMLREEIGIIAGSRRLAGLGFELFRDHDEDFLTFVAIDSETDHLPVDVERHNWSVEALERKDKEIAGYEVSVKTDALETCRKLIERFAVDSGF
jgi:hypothetical protein